MARRLAVNLRILPLNPFVMAILRCTLLVALLLVVTLFATPCLGTAVTPPGLCRSDLMQCRKRHLRCRECVLHCTRVANESHVGLSTITRRWASVCDRLQR